MDEKHSVKEILKKENVLSYVESYFRDGTNVSIAKALYTLQKGMAFNEPKITLKKLSQACGIDENVIRERVKYSEIDISLILDYRKDKNNEWIGLTVLGIGYLEEGGMVDPHRFELF